MSYRNMELVTFEDYLDFRQEADHVKIGNVSVALKGPYNIVRTGPPDEYIPESATVWSFPDRGDWATHHGNYRGNWSPYIPRNVILKYTQEGEVVLDQMCGSGTTLVECRLLGRHGIGVDINRDSIMVTRDRLNFAFAPRLDNSPPESPIETYVGDARNLNLIADSSIDLVATHPPYAGIIQYSDHHTEGDLSSLKLEDYLTEMHAVAFEAYRVIKPGGHCAILIGDTRKHLHYIPISYRVLQVFLDVNFILREDIIKLQWKTKTTRERWRGASYTFYKIAHEHLFIFRKPDMDERTTQLRHSMKWWTGALQDTLNASVQNSHRKASRRYTAQQRLFERPAGLHNTNLV